MILTCSFRKRRPLGSESPGPLSMSGHSCQDLFSVSRHISVFSAHLHHSLALLASHCTIASVERSGTKSIWQRVLSIAFLVMSPHRLSRTSPVLQRSRITPFHEPTDDHLRRHMPPREEKNGILITYHTKFYDRRPAHEGPLFRGLRWEIFSQIKHQH